MGSLLLIAGCDLLNLILVMRADDAADSLVVDFITSKRLLKL